MIRALFDLVVPPSCAACGSEGPEGVCADCVRVIRLSRCPDLAWELLAPGVAAIAAFPYRGPLREALRGVKAAGRHAALGGLVGLLHETVDLPMPSAGLAWTWVPSTRRRVRRRGVDVARAFARDQGVRLLERIQERPDQTDLDSALRRTSPLGSFRPTRVAPPAVVLFDDIRTTGGTLAAAAGALRAAGARRVLAVTLAVSGR